VKADKNKMFPVALSELHPELPSPFPLFVYLPLNDRMVEVRKEGDSLGPETYERLQREHHEQLWVPESHATEVKAFLEVVAKTRSPKNSVPPVLGKSAQIRERTGKLLKQEKPLAAEALEELSELARELLEEPQAEEMRAYADELIAAAAEDSPLFEAVRLLRAQQGAQEHSVFVGSAATALAAAAGHSDPGWIARLLCAATFHDIGLVKVRQSVLAKNRQDRSTNEQAEFEAHVSESVHLLETSIDEIPKDVTRMVAEHHESPDGTGFPGGLKAGELHEGSRYLFLANELVHLCEGENGADGLSPKDALSRLEKYFPEKLKNALLNH